MKKCLSLFAVAALAISLTSCGDNKTKQKIVGVNVIDKDAGGSISVAATPTVTTTQTYTNSHVAITNASSQVSTVLSSVMTNASPSVPAAPTSLAAPSLPGSGFRSSESNQKAVAFSSDTTSGWYSYSYTGDANWNYTMRYHLTDSTGKTITPVVYDGNWEGEQSSLAIKKYEFQYSGFWDADGYRRVNNITTTDVNPLKRCTYTGSYTMDYTTAGEYKGGVTTNGTYQTIMLYKDGAQQTYTTILTNLSFAFTGTTFKYTGGSYSMTYYDWSYYVAFDSSGNGSGYCKGPGYNYRITVNGTTGDWTYTAQ